MSAVRVDTTSWLPGAVLVGDAGFGVLGSAVPSSGGSGAGFLYNDLSLPADADKEVCGRITSWPSAGTLIANEDSSFTFSGAADGSYSFDYTLYVDGVAFGTATVTLNVGVVTHSATGALVAGAASIASVAVHPHVASGILIAQAAVVSGAARRGFFSDAQLAEILDYVEANMAVWDETIEGSMTARQMMRIMAAAMVGTSQKAGNTITFKGVDGTTDRIVGSFDSENNRVGAILDGS